LECSTIENLDAQPEVASLRCNLNLCLRPFGGIGVSVSYAVQGDWAITIASHFGSFHRNYMHGLKCSIKSWRMAHATAFDESSTSRNTARLTTPSDLCELI
jgi:hypothetical protein